MLQLGGPEFASCVQAADPTLPARLTIAASVTPCQDGGSTIVVNGAGVGVWLHASLDLLTLPRLAYTRLRAAPARLVEQPAGSL